MFNRIILLPISLIGKSIKNSINLLLILIVSLLIFISCSDSSNPSSVTPFGDDFTYPLKVGNKWTYNQEFSRYNFRPDSAYPDASMNDTTFSSTIQAEITREEIIQDSLNTYVLTVTEQRDNGIYMSEHFYNNSNDGLYIYAYRAGPTSIVYPKISSNLQYKINGHYSTSNYEISSLLLDPIFKLYELNADSLMIENPPVQTLRYPFKINDEWTYKNNAVRINKKIIGKEIVIVPTGQYECYKIQWLYYFSNSGVWSEIIQIFDYISSKGLIKRTFLYKNLIVSTMSNPSGIGLMDGKEDIILTGINF